jgi:hypothetical protein
VKHKEPTYVRDGKVIINLKDGTQQTYPSVSAAKQQSMHLQKAQGVLGDGFLAVKKRKQS